MEKQCWLCGRNGAKDPLDRHHIFPGKNRKLSEKYGLVVWLCHSRCHLGYGPEGRYAAHKNADTRAALSRWGQLKAMAENQWSEEDFIHEFGRNYL